MTNTHACAILARARLFLRDCEGGYTNDMRALDHDLAAVIAVLTPPAPRPNVRQLNCPHLWGPEYADGGDGPSRRDCTLGCGARQSDADRVHVTHEQWQRMIANTPEKAGPEAGNTPSSNKEDS